LSCPTPKVDCTKKILPARTSGSHSEVIRRFEEFRIAVQAGQVQAFFNTERWRPLFPHFNIPPQHHLNMLRTGACQMVEKSNGIPGQYFYIALPLSVDPSNFDVTDAIFACEVLVP